MITQEDLARRDAEIASLRRELIALVAEVRRLAEEIAKPEARPPFHGPHRSG